LNEIFKEIIQGRRVVIRTDHKPHAFHQRLDKASPRQARQLDLIAQFTTEIVHLAGGENIVADTLSRVNANLPVIVTTEELAEQQAGDVELQQLRGMETLLELKNWLYQDLSCHYSATVQGALYDRMF